MLTASDADFGTGFGSSLAISGVNVVISGRSSAYVFTRTGDGAWSEQAKLLPSDDFVTDHMKSFGNSVSVDGDTAVVGAYLDGENGGAAYVFDLAAAHSAIALHCPGDVTGDGLAELVLVSGADVRVKDLAGTEINRFELTGMTGAVDSELMPDTNGNGAPELVALGGSPATAEVRDLLTGGDLGTVTFDAELAPFDLELVGDQTGNGIPELAALAEDPMQVGVRDGLTGTAVGGVEFSLYSLGKDLLIYPDQNGNGDPSSRCSPTTGSPSSPTRSRSATPRPAPSSGKSGSTGTGGCSSRS